MILLIEAAQHRFGQQREHQALAGDAGEKAAHAFGAPVSAAFTWCRVRPARRRLVSTVSALRVGMRTNAALATVVSKCSGRR